jgi:hypothetical protein
MRQILIIIHLIFLSASFSAQNYILSGKISDQNENLPFATILVKGTTFNTISNVDGEYALKLPGGTYEIIFQYIGYARKSEQVILDKNKTLNVNLSPDGISLKEVEIKAGEDPAYPILRQAIKKRKYYLNQLESYSCKAYIKGLQKINTTPKNMSTLVKLAGGELSDTSYFKGVIYLSESVSKYYYQAPDDEKEIMESSKVSGDNRSFSFNKLAEMKINFYKNQIDLYNLSDRSMTSPLNDNAFLFYRYFLQGKITNEGKTIYKIKVVPKRDNDPCFAGMIYIQDSSWRITSVDFLLTKATKIKFVDTLYIKQLHTPVLEDSIWLPLNLSFGFDFKAFGFKGTGYFNANLSEYEINPILPEGFFKNETLKVDDQANKKDSAYWNAIRKIPLTQEETNDYREKDSLFKIRNTDTYKDSMDHVRNRLKWRDVFLGYTFKKTKSNFNVTVPGLITDGLQYNTIEGLNLSYKFSASKTYKDLKRYNISGKVRYGFANYLWGGELGFNYLFRQKKFSSIGFKLKSITEQFNRQEPIMPVLNSIYTLFENENYMKLFKESGMELNYFSELINGIYFYGNINYMQRDPLKNSTNLLISDDKSQQFTSNDPQNPNTEDSAFVSNSAFTSEFSFFFRFKQKYYTLPNQKIITGSKYPRFGISYRGAFTVFNTNVNYHLISLSISDELKLGLIGRFGFRLKGGSFLSAKSTYFMDYKHFMGNQTIYSTTDYLNSFRLLPYYTYSTNKWYLEGHAEHHFLGLMMDKVPLLKKLGAQEIVGVHYLSNDFLDYYCELNFGLEKVLRVLRFDYVLAYSSDNKLRQGFTFGINLSL